MSLLRSLLALGLLAAFAATPAHAQFQPPSDSFARPSQGSPWEGAPGSPPAQDSPWSKAPASATGPSPFDRPMQMQEPPCMKEFMPLRDDAGKKAEAVRNAAKRKVSPPEACKLFNALVAAQVKLHKFAAANVTSCGIPKEVPGQIQTAITQTESVRARVCDAAARGPAQTGPSLSDALGTSQVANPTNVKKGGGTFDTLSGSALGR